MLRQLVILMSLIAVALAFPISTPAEEFSPDTVALEAETEFRNLMEAWAYDQHWRMWEMGTEASRKAISQTDFSDRMRQSNITPAAGKQVEAIKVYPHSANNADVYARFTLENNLLRRHQTFTVTFPAFKEWGRWTFQLGDILNLLNSDYWYSDYEP